MKRLLLALMVVGCAQTLVAQTNESNTKPSFHPSQALSVTDIQLPTFCQANGVIVLDVPVSEAGEAQPVEVRRDMSCLTPLALQAVATWGFSAANYGDQPIASRVPVVAVFRPPDSVVTPVSLPDLKPQSEAATQAEFQPAEVLHAAYPEYPYDTVAYGTVVLGVTLSAKGGIENVNVLRDLAPLTATAKAVLAKWRFMPATLNGQPVRSSMLLAFVYSQIYTPPPNHPGGRGGRVPPRP